MIHGTLNEQGFSSKLVVQFQSREDPAFHGSIHVESCLYVLYRITASPGGED